MTNFRALNNPYNFSFIAASLRPELARIVAGIYLDCRDWNLTKKRVLDENAFQVTAKSSAARLEIEIRHRLQTLTRRQIEILATAPSDSRVAIAWLSVLKKHAFIFDFTSEVLRAKLENLDAVLRPSDYENFFHSKSVSHPELSALKPVTQSKIQSIVITMLREVGILGENLKEFSISRPVLPTEVLDSILDDSPSWLAGFVVPDDEIASLKE